MNNEMYPIYENINTDISDICYLRRTLYTLYTSPNPGYLQNIKAYISDSIDYNYMIYYTHTFTIKFKIKKTSMKKIKDFSHTPEFYYNRFINAFYLFINDNRAIIYQLLKEYNKEYILDKIDSNKLLLYNMCNITCIDDDIIFVTL